MTFVRTILSPLLILFVFVSFTQAQTIRGVVREMDNGEAIVGATLKLQFSRRGSAPVTIASNPDGSFIFEKIRVGYYSLEVVAQGFETQIIKEIKVVAGKEQVLDLSLRNTAAQLAEVTISAIQPGRRTPLPLSEIPLTLDQTFRFPAMFFDPARLAGAYPGVAQTDDGTNSISIRGNSPASVRWRLEGVDIVNPNHLSNAGTLSDRPSAASGGILMFSAQLLDNSSLLTGAYPAGYGDAFGGIMDMRLRRGNNRRHEFTAQAGLVGLDVAAEGPLRKPISEESDYMSDKFSSSETAAPQKPVAPSTNKGSYLVNYRYSTVGLLGQLGVSFGDEQINFQDLSVHLSFDGKNGGRWSIFALGGLSKNIFKQKTDTAELKAFKDFFDIDYKAKTGAVGISNWSPMGRGASVKIALAISGQQIERDARSETFFSNSTLEEFGETKISGSLTLKQKLKKGFEVSAGTLTLLQRYEVTRGFSFGFNAVNNTYTLFQPWANLSWRSSTNKTSFDLGVHGLYLLPEFYEKFRSAEPRFQLSQVLAKGHKVAFSAGLYSQIPPPWFQPQFLDPVKSRRMGLGYTWDATAQWRFGVEAFWQFQKNVGVHVQELDAFSVVNVAEFDVDGYRQIASNGKAENKGLEFSASRQLSDGWFILANLTLLESKAKGSDGVWRSTRWDIGHISNLTFGKEWQREKRPGKERVIGLGGRALWSGGPREGSIDLDLSETRGYTVYEPTSGYFNQYPDYFRLDLRVYWRKNLDNRRNSTFALDLQNLTGRENLAFHYYDPFTNKVENKFQLGTIPNFSWRLEF